MSREFPHIAATRKATLGFTDLLFAFGFSRLDEETTERSLQTPAPSYLRTGPEDGEWQGLAQRAFAYRIDEALTGRPHGQAIEGELARELDE